MPERDGKSCDRHGFSESWLLATFLLMGFAMICLPLFQGAFYGPYDVQEQFYPARAFYALSLERGEFGFWNPWELRGFDNLGEGQGGIFHPMHYLFYRFLPASLGFALEEVLGPPLILLGMWWLLRRLYGFRANSALFGAGVFAFGAFVYAHLLHVHNIWQIAHIPPSVICLESIFRSQRRFAAAAGLGVLYALNVYLGHPQFVFLTSLILALITLFRGIEGRFGKTFWKSMALVATSAIIAVLLSAIQVLPTLAALEHSSRGNMSPSERSNYGIHPFELLQNISPQTYRHNVCGDFVTTGSGNQIYSFNSSEYTAYFGVGIVSVLFFSIMFYRESVFARYGKTRTYLVLMGGLLFLIMMLGKYGLANNLLVHIPFVSQFRAAGRYFLVLSFLLSISLAALADIFQSNMPKIDKTAPRKALLCFAPTLTSLIGVVSLVAAGSIHRSSGPAGVEVTFEPWYLLALGPLIAAITLFFFRMAVSGKRWAWQMVFVICLADIFCYAYPVLSELPLMSFRKAEELVSNMRDHTSLYRRISEDLSPLYDGHYMANGYMAIIPGEKLDFSDPQQTRLASLEAGIIKGKAYPFRDPLPRFYLVNELRSMDDSLGKLGDIDLTVTALTSSEFEPLGFCESPMKPQEKVHLLDDGYDNVRLSVEVASKRLLVSTDRWDDGWKVYIDGVERPIIPLFEYSLRGVIVEPTDKNIHFSYEPAELYQGLKLAAVGFLIILGLLALEFIIWKKSVKATPDEYSS